MAAQVSGSSDRALPRAPMWRRSLHNFEPGSLCGRSAQNGPSRAIVIPRDTVTHRAEWHRATSAAEQQSSSDPPWAPARLIWLTLLRLVATSYSLDAPESPAPPCGPCVGGFTLAVGFMVNGRAPNSPVEPFGCAPRSSLSLLSAIAFSPTTRLNRPLRLRGRSQAA